MPTGTVVDTKLTLLRVGDLLVVGGRKFRVMVVATTELGANMVVSPITTGTSSASVPLNRTEQGFDAAGGAGNNRNTAAYVDATGIITFTTNGGAANVANIFPVGSYFSYAFLQGALKGNQLKFKPLRVTASTPTTITTTP